MGQPRLDVQGEHIIRVMRHRNVGTIFGHSKGGPADQPPILDRPLRQDFTEMNREPLTHNDTLIQHERGILWRRPNYQPPANGWVNWTECGPAKDLPTTRFNRNWRPIVGGGHRAQWGQHTYMDSGQHGGSQLAGKSRMRPAKQNQLTVQRYRGQSYSSTTNTVGR